MKIREYKTEDAEIICSWIRTEDELYRWSADRFNVFPITGDIMNKSYVPQLEGGRFFPITAVDEDDMVIGHLIIRYPREDDDTRVRFGFVVIDPELRGKGVGKEMLLQAVEYVKEHFDVNTIDLGVFDNNPAAKHCYEAVGFKEYNVRDCEMPIGNWLCIDMELSLKK